MRIFFALCTALLLSAPAWSQSVPGGVYVFPLPQGTVSASYDGRPVLIREGHGYVGIGIKTTPGTKVVKLSGGEQTSHSFEVVAKQYPEQHLTIKNKKMVNPDPESLTRIREESSRMKAEYRRFSQVNAVTSMIKPVQGITSSQFGFRRVLNGQPRNPHSGLDIAADTGTPIAAAADGVVRITGDFYYNGNTVILDHGQGLVTMYCHLSEIKAKDGENLKQGEILGLVGATGRVTGPHLHWSVSMNGYRVDPLRVLDLFPAPQQEEVIPTETSIPAATTP